MAADSNNIGLPYMRFSSIFEVEVKMEMECDQIATRGLSTLVPRSL
jgi:hypothetical protein